MDVNEFQQYRADLFTGFNDDCFFTFKAEAIVLSGNCCGNNKSARNNNNRWDLVKMLKSNIIQFRVIFFFPNRGILFV